MLLSMFFQHNGLACATSEEVTWWLRWQHGDMRSAYNPDGAPNGHPRLEHRPLGSLVQWYAGCPHCV